MSHYCDSLFPKAIPTPPDLLDAVCYADYFSTMNDGFNALGTGGALGWPVSVAWSVFPYAQNNDPKHFLNPGSNHCMPGLTVCQLVMAGFDLEPLPAPGCPPDPGAGCQDPNLRQNLVAMGAKCVVMTDKDGIVQCVPPNNPAGWFNNALQWFPTDLGKKDTDRHFPWTGTQVSWATDVYPHAVRNPFLGQFTYAPLDTCDVGLTGANCTPAIRHADHFLYPRQCSLADLAATTANQDTNVAKLRQCGLNYEFHHNGWVNQWPQTQSFLNAIQPPGADMAVPNQYGRTSFLFAGVPGMQMPVSFYHNPNSMVGLCSPTDRCSVYEQVHNASLFSLYLPIANEADVRWAFNPVASIPNQPPPTGRNYTDIEFYHTLLMSNHMESDYTQFAEGIRGKVLWHNEYRSEKMYDAFVKGLTGGDQFPTQNFPAGFDSAAATVAYHNHTCDGCHVRNGSGIPINTQKELDKAISPFMVTDQEYSPYSTVVFGTGACGNMPCKDYTFTGEILPMKLVFFDLHRNDAPAQKNSVYSEPLTSPSNTAPQYQNKIMNFYGDSFHLNDPLLGTFGYSWSLKTISIPENHTWPTPGRRPNPASLFAMAGEP